jgi:hypothetical protein
MTNHTPRTMTAEALDVLREYADIAEAGGKPHWAKAMREALSRLQAVEGERDKTKLLVLGLQQDLFAAESRALSLRKLLGGFAVEAMQCDLKNITEWAMEAKIEFPDGAPVYNDAATGERERG